MENISKCEKIAYTHIKIPAFAERIFNRMNDEECKRILTALFRCMETGEFPEPDTDPRVCLIVKFLIYADMVEEMIDRG